MMIIRCSLALAAIALAATPLGAEEAHRAAGAHEHGHSRLDIAIEGNRIEMALTAPGADIVGFEHAATSDADQAAVAEAKAMLGMPLQQFVLPAAAGCTVSAATVELQQEHGEHADEAEAHADDHAEHEGEAEAHADDHGEHEGEAGHNEFHATYALSCADPAKLDGITFAFFDRFPGAQEVEVSVITENGQSSFEVTRGEPRIELQGLM